MKKRIIRSACGFTVADAFRDAKRDLTKKNVDQDEAIEWRKTFDRATDRAKNLTWLISHMDTDNAERRNLIIIRNEHQRLARGLAKLLWKVI